MYGPPFRNETGQPIDADWLKEVRECLQVTLDVLHELERAGCPAKQITEITLIGRNHPAWVGTSDTEGRIEITPSQHEARSVAHEAGHGLDERWRREDRPRRGDSIAEAIRYFVEQRMGPSDWKPRQDWRLVLDKCGWSFDRFKELLAGEELHHLESG